MLLQALHKYAEQRKLLDRLPFQVRTVHLLIPLNADGSVRGNGFITLTTPVTVGNKTKEEPGRDLLMPRFPGENNGGKAYYLAESFNSVLGVRKEAGEPLPSTDTGKDRNPVRAFEHYWERISSAAIRTEDVRLKTLLAFRDMALTKADGPIRLFGWLKWQPNEASREKKPEWHGKMANGEWKPITKLVTLGFEIGGTLLAVPKDDWQHDPVWKDWAGTYRSESFTEDSTDPNTSLSSETICLITGQTGQPIARSHKPKILGVPGLASGGYVVSFAKESPAFSSFGYEMGANAPVSEAAAASYALGLNDLLTNDDTHFSVGGVTFCFWAEKYPAVASANARMMTSAKPAVVKEFLKGPFAGVPREVYKSDRFISVALSANAGRVVVREWLRVPLDEAIENFAEWFRDLEIAALSEERVDDGERGAPYSLFRLAVALVRESGELDQMSEAVTLLYRAAWDDSTPPVRLLAPLLAEFQSALVTDTPKKPKFPFNQSRFALLKLILLRNRKGGFMPTAHLCETDDEAYNLGRLLCVLAALQDAAHDYELEGPGVVERYYGAASTAPANVFGVLWKLHVHHLRKLEKSKQGSTTARRLRGELANIVAQFAPGGPGQPPRFPSTLSLEAQGRFALGFYQQMAADRKASRVFSLLKKAREEFDKDKDRANLILEEAKQLVASGDYPDLLERVNKFQFTTPEQE